MLLNIMVRVGESQFGPIGCLVTTAAFNFGKVVIVTINDAFLDLNYTVYIF
ncbi:glyceraldehyde-3-phosphate dehydrogenase, partial [Lynx pardinus]